jgi:hypothetical protein
MRVQGKSNTNSNISTRVGIYYERIRAIEIAINVIEPNISLPKWLKFQESIQCEYRFAMLLKLYKNITVARVLVGDAFFLQNPSS